MSINIIVDGGNRSKQRLLRQGQSGVSVVARCHFLRSRLDPAPSYPSDMTNSDRGSERRISRRNLGLAHDRKPILTGFGTRRIFDGAQDPQGPPCVALSQSNSESHEGSHSSDLLTVPELATLLRVSKTSVYRLVEGRRLPFYRFGGALRFERGAVASFLSRHLVRSITDDRV